MNKNFIALFALGIGINCWSMENLTKIVVIEHNEPVGQVTFNPNKTVIFLDTEGEDTKKVALYCTNSHKIIK